MQLIFGKDNAEKLRERYVVLDLETVEKDGVSIEVYCLIPGDKIGLPDMPQIDNWTKLHHEMMDGFHTQQYKYVSTYDAYNKHKRQTRTRTKLQTQRKHTHGHTRTQAR